MFVCVCGVFVCMHMVGWVFVVCVRVCVYAHGWVGVCGVCVCVRVRVCALNSYPTILYAIIH